MKPLRKKNSKRSFNTWVEYVQKLVRKRVETSFSQIESKFPKFIHAVTSKGFEPTFRTTKCSIFEGED